MNLSLGFISSRFKPELNWLIDSLVPQLAEDDRIDLVVVSDHFEIYGIVDSRITVEHYEPKPCVWSGRYKLTKEPFWSKSNSLNTFFCLAKFDYVALCDDRCVLGPQWMQAVREAYAANRLILGSYAKYHNMKVENGKIVEQGTFSGKDGRGYSVEGIHKAPPQHFFGCTWCSPLDWILQINGALEKLDGTSMEDVMMGHHLHNANYILKHDGRLFVTQDRTPSECGPVMKRTSKERFPYDQKDRAWTALATFGKQNRADNGYDLRQLRDEIQKGGRFPMIDPGARDWWSGLTIAEFEDKP